MLQDLIKKAQELCAKAELVIKEAGDIILKYDQLIFGLNEQKKTQEGKDVELKARENKVKNIENAKALHDSAVAMESKNKAERGIIAHDKAEFEEYRKNAEADISNRKALQDRREKELDARSKKLDEDYETYKQRVTREIFQNLKGK